MGTARPNKLGRNKAGCLTYKNQHRREVNAARRMVRHAKRAGYQSSADFPKDLAAAWQKVSAIVPNPTLKALVNGVFD